jgi:hypothetical protein
MRRMGSDLVEKWQSFTLPDALSLVVVVVFAGLRVFRLQLGHR